MVNNRSGKNCGVNLYVWVKIFQLDYRGKYTENSKWSRTYAWNYKSITKQNQDSEKHKELDCTGKRKTRSPTERKNLPTAENEIMQRMYFACKLCTISKYIKERSKRNYLLDINVTDQITNECLRSKTQITDIATKIRELKWNRKCHVVKTTITGATRLVKRI